MGALAALNAEDVERRWGEIGLRAWRLANADDARRPVLARVETQPAVEVELTIPAATMEPVLFLVRAALERLVHDMIAHGRAVAAVAITLTLDDARGALVDAPAHTVTREARTARSLARVLPLFERCRALLDSWTLDAPVSAVRVAIVAVAPLSGEQGDLLSTSWRDLGATDGRSSGCARSSARGRSCVPKCRTRIGRSEPAYGKNCGPTRGDERARGREGERARGREKRGTRGREGGTPHCCHPFRTGRWCSPSPSGCAPTASIAAVCSARSPAWPPAP